MKKIYTKHFQYTGMDDFEKGLDSQINDFIDENNLTPDNIINVSYSSHAAAGANVYTALVIVQE